MLIRFSVYQSVGGVVTSQRWGLMGGNRRDSCNNDLVEYNESTSCFALRSHNGLMQVGHDMNEDYYLSMIEPLTNREMEILQYVTRGMSNKEIAAKLGISHQTVKNHMTAILHKLDVEDRTQAAVYALRHGWVRLQDTRK